MDSDRGTLIERERDVYEIYVDQWTKTRNMNKMLNVKFKLI